MQLTRKKATKKSSVVAKKKKQSFNFKSFWSALQNVNKDNIGSAPLVVRLFFAALAMALVLGVVYGLIIRPTQQSIASAVSQQAVLLEQYREKESKARYLDEYKQQIEQMDRDFAILLSQLPQQTAVPELIDGINKEGSGSGIRFQDISEGAEVEKELFIEQPIKITAVGEYHQFGNFLTGVAALPRIITMHDFEIKNQHPSLTVMPELQLVLNTKTYRAKAVQEEENAAGGSN